MESYRTELLKCIQRELSRLTPNSMGERRVEILLEPKVSREIWLSTDMSIHFSPDVTASEDLEQIYNTLLSLHPGTKSIETIPTTPFEAMKVKEDTMKIIYDEDGEIVGRVFEEEVSDSMNLVYYSDSLGKVALISAFDPREPHSLIHVAEDSKNLTEAMQAFIKGKVKTLSDEDAEIILAHV
jgi:hypothetical protein